MDRRKVRSIVDNGFPQFSSLLEHETVASITQVPLIFSPSFPYAGPRLNQGDRTFNLGDSALTVKLYFDFVANNALDAVKILKEAIDSKKSRTKFYVHLLDL